MKKAIDWMVLSVFLKRVFLLTAIVIPNAVTSVPNRTDSFDLTTLQCQIGAATSHDDDHPSSELTNYDFEYWYAIGTDGDISMQTLFQVEQLLYTSIDQSILWCTEIQDSAVTQNLDVGNRKAQEDTTKESGEVRRLGVVTFTPGVLDQYTEYTCPQGLEDIMENTRATDCEVVHGKMRIIAHSIDDVSYAVVGLRDGIETAMLAGIGQNNEILNITFLVYLGDNKTDALSGPYVGAVGGGTSSVATGNDNGSTAVYAPEEDDEDNMAVGLIVIIILIAIAVILAAMFAKRHKMLTAAAAEVFYATGEQALIGTGDHPFSFHEGIYHYLPNGQRYFSTCCEECLETRKHLLFSNPSSSFASDAADQDLQQISAYHSRNCRDTPSNAVSNEGLGQHHMGMNVQKCTSFLCKRCQPGDTSVEPIFVPSMGHRTKDDASSSTPLSIFSKKWQPDEEYLPEQAEV